jgi:HAD superfamily hydrolase (TIGR01549 family)
VRTPVFDLDGTLLDSDRALADAFVALGVPREEVTFGHVVADECRRRGIVLDAYLDAYDETAATPYAGVTALLEALDEWAVCSNKHPRSGTAELNRLGWSPRVALFADAFAGPKRLGPVLAALSRRPAEVVFIGDTDHDRHCAQELGVPFGLAAWNRRAAALARAGDVVLRQPSAVLDWLATI